MLLLQNLVEPSCELHTWPHDLSVIGVGRIPQPSTVNTQGMSALRLPRFWLLSTWTLPYTSGCW